MTHCIENDGYTLMWKTAYLQKMPKAIMGRGGLNIARYHWCHTEAIGAIRFELWNTGSKERKGLYYTQLYLTNKNQFSASGIYPWSFKDEILQLLLLPDTFANSLTATESNHIRFTQADCLESHSRTGRRVAMELTSNDGRSYGVRQEHHISLSLLGEIVRQMKLKDWPLFGIPHRDELPFYIIRTELANRYTLTLVKTYGRFLQEILSLSLDGMFSESQRKLGHVVIDLLRSSYHVTHLQRMSGILWYDKFPKGNAGY